jgi:hypothetical protein
MNSEIRAWINNEFYQTVFSELQQALILTTTVDNGASSTGSNPNQYACANTNDKIFLLSYTEVLNSSYGFSSSWTDTAKRMITSDYSRATGAYMDTGRDYYGDGYWWLRSPDTYYLFVRNVFDTNGGANSFGSTRYGIVPALKIRLS